MVFIKLDDLLSKCFTNQDGMKRPITPLENTYQLEPEVKFSESAVSAIIREVLEGQLEEETYDERATRQVIILSSL